MIPVVEVFYWQDAPTGYKPDSKSSPVGEWIFEPGISNDEYWRAHRVLETCTQTVILVVHRAPPDFQLERDNKSIRLFRELLALEPLEVAHHPHELQLYFGWSSSDTDWLYIRQRGPEDPLLPLVPIHWLDETLEPWGLGVEDVILEPMDRERCWWVAYLERADQQSVQAAWDRLHRLHSWLAKFSVDSIEPAIESLGRWLAEKVE